MTIHPSIKGIGNIQSRNARFPPGAAVLTSVLSVW